MHSPGTHSGHDSLQLAPVVFISSSSTVARRRIWVGKGKGIMYGEMKPSRILCPFFLIPTHTLLLATVYLRDL